MISNIELIKKAKSVAKSRKIKNNFTVGDVGCALESESGKIYFGVCIDVACGIGFCAEHSAIAAMVTAGELKIKRILAVLENGKVIPPCGRCREFINQLHDDNINTEILLSEDKSMALKDLLPLSWDQ